MTHRCCGERCEHHEHQPRARPWPPRGTEAISAVTRVTDTPSTTGVQAMTAMRGTTARTQSTQGHQCGCAPSPSAPAAAATPCGYRCHDHGGHDGDGYGDGGGKGDDGTTVGWNNPGRPGRHCGTSTGQVPGGYVRPGELRLQAARTNGPASEATSTCRSCSSAPTPATWALGRWSAPSGRAQTSCCVAGVDPAVAPPVPPALGETAVAGVSNTVYAHVWNFGLSQAPNVVVEFYWCDPTLGIGPAGAHLIGQTDRSRSARGGAAARTRW